jgi:hypothetical protein
MKNETSVTLPHEAELVEFFGSEPHERAPADGYWSYEATDSRGIGLQLSFNILERSVQTVLSLLGEEVAVISHEGLTSVVLQGTQDKRVLIAETHSADTKSRLHIELVPTIQVLWSTLLLAHQ